MAQSTGAGQQLGASRTIRRALGLLALVLAWAAPPSRAQLPAGVWQYHWGDEFSGTTLDTTKWSHSYPWGNTHNHDAYMSPSNVLLGDGTLTLRAERLAQGGKAFTSGAVSTGYSRFTTDSGYIEARILLPETPGSWPAFWGLYDGWPPEADIMEYPIDTAAGSGYAQDQYHTAFHFRNTSGGNSAGAGQVNPGSAGDLGGSYHNFGMEWRADDWVGFYFDGALVSQFGDNAAIAQMQQMYLILNYAVGGWPGTPSTTEWPVGFADETKVDWVRVWKSAGTRDTSWTNSTSTQTMSWDSTTNWSNGLPNLGGVTATLGTVTPSLQRLDWNNSRTVSQLQFTGSTLYQLGGRGDRLVLANSGGVTGTIHVASTSTAAHRVLADVELFGTGTLSNDSASTLTLSGEVNGAGGLNIEGPGTVLLTGANTYTGSTTIDSGTPGPAVLRVRGPRPLGTGTVALGPVGNSTTARIELEVEAKIANDIQFAGRNNSSIGIQNLSGNGIVSGTISLAVGGSNYLIDSTAGTLWLTGATGGGVALRGEATGARTLTLQGDSAGVVSGTIANGNATIGVTKQGTGQWLLAGQNTYTGTTLVREGVLELRGTTGTTTIESGGTLLGTGRIRGSLTAQSGANTQVGRGATTIPATTLVDDFSRGNLSQYTRTIVNDGIVASNNMAFSIAGGVLQAAFSGTASIEQVLLLRDDFSVGVGQTLRVDVDMSTNSQPLDFGLAISSTKSPTAASAGDPDTRDSFEWASIAVRSSQDGIRVSRVVGGSLDTSTGEANTVYEHLVTGLYITRTSDTGYTLGYTNAYLDDIATTSFSFVGSNVGTAIGFYSDLRSAGSLGAFDNLRIIDPSPLASADLQLAVDGNMSLATGAVLELDLGPEGAESVAIGGSATVDGILAITLADGFLPTVGQPFQVLSAASLSGQPVLGGPDGHRFSIAPSSPGTIVLAYTGTGLAGDFNNDGLVDAADYVLWRDAVDSPFGTLPNDPTGATIGSAQLAIWQANFGSSLPGLATLLVAVPEPTRPSLLLPLGALAILAGFRRPAERYRTDL